MAISDNPTVSTTIPDDAYRRQVLEYCHALGWAFTPLSGKRPLRDAWQSEPPLALDAVLAHRGNVGLRTGTVSGVVVIDLDPGARAEGLELPETVEVATGRGRHLYYAHSEPLPNSAGKIGPCARCGAVEHQRKCPADPEGKRCNSRIDVRADGGQVVFPGSLHPETRQPYQFLRAPWQCQLEPLPAWIIDFLTSPRPAQPGPSAAPDRRRPAPDHSRRAIVERARRYIARCEPAVSGQQGHNTTYRVAMILLEGFALSLDEARPLMHEFSRRCMPHWTEREIEHKLASAAGGVSSPRLGRLLAQAENAPAAPYAAQDPEDALEGSDYVLIPGQHTDDSGRTIRQSSALFSEQVLSRLPDDLIYIKSQIPGEILGDPGKRWWSELTHDRTRILVDRHVVLNAWIKTRKDERLLMYKPCSNDWAGLVMAGAAHHRHARELTLQVNYPVYVPGWQLIEPGWNAGCFYDQPAELAGLEPERDIEAIHDTLAELVTDFPFADEASRQNFFGLLLTPLVAHACGGNRPLHLIVASRPRTGKSKLAEQIFGGVILGEETPAMQLTGTDEERDKRILGLLLQGGTLLHLDNLPHKLDSPAIASLLTAKVYQGRLLSATRILSLRNNLTMVATGNNVICSNEIAERVVPIVLQPRDANPSARTNFQHPDIQAYVRDNRRLILSVLLGMIENWKSAGQPAGSIPLGGFEAWTAAVGGILRVNAMNSWRKNEREWRKRSDTETQELLTFASAWWSNYKSSTMTPRLLLPLVGRLDIFGWIFNKPQEKAQVTALGMLMKKYIDTPIGGWVIRRRESGGHNAYYLCELPGGE